MNSRQRRRLRRFSERAWKVCGLIGQKIADDLEKFGNRTWWLHGDCGVLLYAPSNSADRRQ